MLKDDTELELYSTGEKNQFYKTTICQEGTCPCSGVHVESLQLLIICRQADEYDIVARGMFPTMPLL